MDNDLDGARVGGLLLKTFTSTQGTKPDEQGKLKIVLEADKEDINTGNNDFHNILAAMNIHQEGQYPVVLRVKVPTGTSS
jgi:hypothetical protein